jgi:hypothetical protein
MSRRVLLAASAALACAAAGAHAQGVDPVARGIAAQALASATKPNDELTTWNDKTWLQGIGRALANTAPGAPQAAQANLGLGPFPNTVFVRVLGDSMGEGYGSGGAIQGAPSYYNIASYDYTAQRNYAWPTHLMSLITGGNINSSGAPISSLKPWAPNNSIFGEAKSGLSATGHQYLADYRLYGTCFSSITYASCGGGAGWTTDNTASLLAGIGGHPFSSSTLSQPFKFSPQGVADTFCLIYAPLTATGKLGYQIDSGTIYTLPLPSSVNLAYDVPQVACVPAADGTASSGLAGYIAPATATLTASISGSTLTVTSGTAVVGGVITSPAVTNNCNTVISANAIAGTYQMSCAGQSVASQSMTETYGLLTLTTGSGPLVGELVTGTGVDGGTTVTQVLSTTTAVVNYDQTVAASGSPETITLTPDAATDTLHTISLYAETSGQVVDILGVTAICSYCNQIDVQNWSASGYSMWDWVQTSTTYGIGVVGPGSQLDNMLEAYFPPALTIIESSTNDALQQQAISTYSNYLSQVVADGEKFGSVVIAQASPTDPTAYGQSLQALDGTLTPTTGQAGTLYVSGCRWQFPGIQPGDILQSYSGTVLGTIGSNVSGNSVTPCAAGATSTWGFIYSGTPSSYTFTGAGSSSANIYANVTQSYQQQFDQAAQAVAQSTGAGFLSMFEYWGTHAAMVSANCSFDAYHNLAPCYGLWGKRLYDYLMAHAP